jgi:hypothetical protein
MTTRISPTPAEDRDFYPLHEEDAVTVKVQGNRPGGQDSLGHGANPRV